MKGRRAPRFYTRRHADQDKVWCVSVFDNDTFGPSPDTFSLGLLSSSQWQENSSNFTRGTLLRTIVELNSIFTYTATSDDAGPPSVVWGLYLTDADDTAINDPALTSFYVEDVLRMGISNHAARFAAANSVNLAEVAPTIRIDTNVKRRLTTASQLRLALSWMGAGGIQSGQFHAITRCLVKIS